MYAFETAKKYGCSFICVIMAVLVVDFVFPIASANHKFVHCLFQAELVAKTEQVALLEERLAKSEAANKALNDQLNSTQVRI